MRKEQDQKRKEKDSIVLSRPERRGRRIDLPHTLRMGKRRREKKMDFYRPKSQNF